MTALRSHEEELTGQLTLSGQLFPENDDRSTLLFPKPWRINEVPSPKLHAVPLYGIKLVRFGSVEVSEPQTFNTPQNAAKVFGKCLQEADREHLMGAFLTTKNTLIGLSTISIGDLTSAPIHPREIYKPAILMSAAAIVLAHNHPSGDPTPSPEDIIVTRRVAEAGDLLGIELLDHLIVGCAGRFVSLRADGYF